MTPEEERRKVAAFVSHMLRLPTGDGPPYTHTVALPEPEYELDEETGDWVEVWKPFPKHLTVEDA